MLKAEFFAKEWHKLYDKVREKLIYQAKINQAISYGKLCQKSTRYKLKQNDEALHEILGEISVNEINNGKGILSVFCGRENQSLMPGNGFFKLAIDLGKHIGNRKDFVKLERELVHQAFRERDLLTT